MFGTDYVCMCVCTAYLSTHHADIMTEWVSFPLLAPPNLRLALDHGARNQYHTMLLMLPSWRVRVQVVMHVYYLLTHNAIGEIEVDPEEDRILLLTTRQNIISRLRSGSLTSPSVPHQPVSQACVVYGYPKSQ